MGSWKGREQGTGNRDQKSLSGEIVAFPSSVPVCLEFWIMAFSDYGDLEDGKAHFFRRFGIPSVFGTI
jgi:hypothetical protein